MTALHITNGDCAADTLRMFLTDPVVITADPLFAGPAPDLDDDGWYVVRARHLSDDSAEAIDTIRRNLAAWDLALDAAMHRGDEIVLWFEHDLFDQLLLVRVLDRIAKVRPDGRATSLICIDRFPGVNRFIGLGQLDAQQLATLLPERKPVAAAQLDLARRAWKAFRSSDPTAFSRLTADPASVSALPFLRSAVLRFLQEFPSTANGLSRTAQAVLDVIEDGERNVFATFAATQQREESPFMGDLGVFDVMDALARARTPLVRLARESAHGDPHLGTISLTDAGRAVRSGQQDAVRLNGIDEWRGGAHLVGSDRSPWRWDAARETLVSLDR